MDQISTYVMAPAPGEEPLVDDSGPNLFSAASVPAPPSLPPDEVQAIMATIMEDITAERDCTYQPISSLFQDFTTRCRMKKIGQHVGDAAIPSPLCSGRGGHLSPHGRGMGAAFAIVAQRAG
jgi:hypothetical protein